jgi:hypothetical protein
MLSFILQKVQQFERDFGVAPNVVYINPQHYAAMCRELPDLFGSGQSPHPGFRIVILPASRLAHPEAALLMLPGDSAGTAYGTGSGVHAGPGRCRAVA